MSAISAHSPSLHSRIARRGQYTPLSVSERGSEDEASSPGSGEQLRCRLQGCDAAPSSRDWRGVRPRTRKDRVRSRPPPRSPCVWCVKVVLL
jgi:hypothetical protein